MMIAAQKITENMEAIMKTITLYSQHRRLIQG